MKIAFLFLANFSLFSNRFQKSCINTTEMIYIFSSSTISSNASAFSSLSVVCLENSLPVEIGECLFWKSLLSSLVGNARAVTVVYKRVEWRNIVNYFVVNMAISDFVFPSTVIPETLSATVNGSWRLVSARIARVIKPCVDRC